MNREAAEWILPETERKHEHVRFGIVKWRLLQGAIPQFCIRDRRFGDAGSKDLICLTVKHGDPVDCENLSDPKRYLAARSGKCVHQHESAAEFVESLHFFLPSHGF